MSYPLGKKSAGPLGKKAIMFSDIFDLTKMPTVPQAFGHHEKIRQWFVYGNEDYGNCVAEGTLVSAPDVSAIHKVKYNGPMISLTLASGKRITVTPNHAVLTPSGFTVAQAIKKGDDLVCTSGSQVLPRPYHSGAKGDFNKTPTPVEEVFSSLQLVGLPVSEVMPASVDFNGDEKFFDGNINVVWANRLLGSENNSALRKPYSQNEISSAGQLKGFFKRACATLLASYRSWLPTHSDVGFGSYSPPLCYAESGVTQAKRLRLSAQYFPRRDDSSFEMFSRQSEFLASALKRCASDVFLDGLANVAMPKISRDYSGINDIPPSIDASFFKPTDNGHFTDPQLFGNLKSVFPGLIETDRVIDVDVQSFKGHVYDLSTDCRWYIAGGIVNHNCVWAAKAHMHMLWPVMGGYTRNYFWTRNVLSDYAEQTGFRADDPNTDQGTDMRSAAEYHRKQGVRDARGNRQRVEAYVNLVPGNMDQLAMATYVFGAVELGVLMTNYNFEQFDRGEPWTVTKDYPIGGHCMPVVGRDVDGNFLCVTWGKIARLSPDFIEKYMDEGIAYLDTQILNKAGLSPGAYDRATLMKMLSKISPQPVIVASADEVIRYGFASAAVDTSFPTDEQFEAAFSILSKFLDDSGYGWAISKDKLRPYSDQIAIAVVGANPKPEGEETQ